LVVIVIRGFKVLS
jgi:hypothetical protein